MPPSFDAGAGSDLDAGSPPSDFDGGMPPSFDGGPGGFGCSPNTLADKNIGAGGSSGGEWIDGEPIAIALDAREQRLIQTREPASLRHFVDGKWIVVSLSATSVEDTGHAIFHSNSGGDLACASCHPDGNDDGRVWTFNPTGPRRTQTFRGGFLATAPFHWDGTLADMPALTTEVFEHRMSGPSLAPDQATALQLWMNALPALPHDAVTDPLASASLDRGRALFTSAAVGCTSCHSGAMLTDNQNHDVGTVDVMTGLTAAFQVPSLIGVGMRAPYMHDGSVATLRGRFDAKGNLHGKVDALSAGQIDDLVAYLTTL